MRFGNFQKYHNQQFHNKINVLVRLQDNKFHQMILNLVSNTTRYYCPILRIDDVGMFDLLAHSQMLKIKTFPLILQHQLKVIFLTFMDLLLITFIMNMVILKFLNININSNYQDIDIIAESSAISAFFQVNINIYLQQLIEGIATNGDYTHIDLLYIADTLEELIWFMEEKKINATFMLRSEKDSIHKLFSGPKGQMKPEHLQQYLPQK